MQSEREHLIAVAQSWVGTRYVDRADVKSCGCDCAGFLKGVCVEAGLVDAFPLPNYHPQQWMHRDFEDTTYLDIVKAVAYEIEEKDVLPADIVMFKVVNSWTHGGIIIQWPERILHSMKMGGVQEAHGTRDGFLHKRAHRFFRLNRWK